MSKEALFSWQKGRNPPPSKPELDNMVFLKGGIFEMGSKNGRSEKTPHTVTLSDYYMGPNEVTFEEYDAFCVAIGKRNLMMKSGDDKNDQ